MVTKKQTYRVSFHLANGLTTIEILEEYPELEPEDIG
ncbi:DUF433 domain-containing protein [Pseudanabaena sp. FACHB-1277]|uniref:DUF433 domain-containing protein n=1 Tax=Pseudanabaena cinerea FACHB-1277 TaxID=2949581 RepID=A0A926UVT3_9CYAN|nr:DUF433 domain-containing protein [Pseudanabaena cinerea FACHB-1277]